jgi:hypothetical protein
MTERRVEGIVISVMPAVGVDVGEKRNFDTWFIDAQVLNAARISLKVGDEVSFMANELPIGLPIITELRKIDLPQCR